MAVTIAVVAPGAMGSAVGARLATRGARVLTSVEGRSPATRERANAAGMETATDEAIAAADIILSVVPPNEALPLAQRFAAHITRIESAPIYVDLNAVNPVTAREVGQALAGCPARYVDGSIIGMPPKPDGAGPTFYLAGETGSAADTLASYGLVVKTLAGGIGAASALKMTYAGMTKGLTALGAAMILAARREGAADALAAELGSSQKELLARLSKSVPDMLPKAYRWVPEMAEIAGFLGSQDPAAGIYAAMSEFYQSIADDSEGEAVKAAELKAFFELPLPLAGKGVQKE